jgi:hypothetical protein
MNRYQLTLTPSQLSIKPYFGYKGKIRLFGLLALLLFGSLPFLRELIGYDLQCVGYVLGGCMVVYALYDFLFHLNVTFLFDKETGSIYKINSPFYKKRLMGFEEMLIINSWECGAMHYVIGRKGKQFLKNYSISDTFTDSKKSREREVAYIEEVLGPILDFVRNA